MPPTSIRLRLRPSSRNFRASPYSAEASQRSVLARAGNSAMNKAVSACTMGYFDLELFGFLD